MSPALLLMFTFIIGSGSVFITPAYQSLVPELVPREDVPSAVQLNSINVNIARAVGPAIAGIVIAHSASARTSRSTRNLLVYAVVVAFWRPRQISHRNFPNDFSALRAGGRYVRYPPIVRRIFLRATLFLVPASALWGLLPLVASRRLELGPSGYGLLLGALGIGAVTGATSFKVRAGVRECHRRFGGILLRRIHRRGVRALDDRRRAHLDPTGATWVWMLATLNTSLQLFLPAWVRARGLSIYQMVLFGAQGLGAGVGRHCRRLGITVAFVASAAVLAVGTASFRRWPLFDTAHMDRASSFDRTRLRDRRATTRTSGRVDDLYGRAGEGR